MIQQPEQQKQVQRRRTNRQAKPGTEADKTATGRQTGHRQADRPEAGHRQADRPQEGQRHT